MKKLDIHRKSAQTGKADSALVFLHGYGANAADLLGLADVLDQHLPATVFLAPDAPEPCRGNPFGFQWFPVPWLDGSSDASLQASLLRSSTLLHEWLTGLQESEGIPLARTILFGFSQGTMMALHVAPGVAPPLGGIVGFSGRLVDASVLTAAISRPPVLLVHGDADQTVPFSSLAEAENSLKANGFVVTTHVASGVGHGISPDGLGQALQFIQGRLNQN